MSSDEICASSSKGKEIMVVDVEDRLDNQSPHISTESSQPNSTNSNSTEEKPSIFSDIPRVVAFVLDVNSFRETLPLKFVEFMKQWHGLEENKFLEDIRANEVLVLSYFHRVGFYDENWSDQTRNDFLDLLLLNSCITIFVFVILSFQTVRNGTEILAGTDRTQQRYKDFYILYQHITSANPRSVKCGMLDMDRQIPWFVVEAVYTKHSNLSKLVGWPIDRLALSCFDDLYPGVHKSKVKGDTLPPGGFKHLLHMFHWSRTPQGMYQVNPNPLQPIESMDSFYIPTATELLLSETVYEKHAGIHVSYTDRRFLSGAMQLAPLHIFKYSKETYQNLLRFEQGYVKCGFPVTAYVACMWFLLRTEEDVTLLRANGIVPSTRNNEEGVLGFLDYLKREQSVLSDEVRMPDDLINLSKKVREHHERKSSRYYADFKSRYCPTPWIAISGFAAFCLFALTVIQGAIAIRDAFRKSKN